MAKRRGKKKSIPKLMLWAGGMLLLGAISALALQNGFEPNWKKWGAPPAAGAAQRARQNTGSPHQSGAPAPVPNQPSSTVPAQTRPAPAPQSMKPLMALVIDDLGQADPALVLRLCSLNVPITAAVLPFLPNSRDSANIAYSKGMEVILHMPMEPVGYPGPGRDPGPGAVLFALPETTVRQRVAQAMQDVPHAVGLNNHMGSRITSDRARMSWILEEAKKSNWYFLDSRTEKDTVAMEVAREVGVPALERQVFLDDSLDPAEMAYQWKRAIAIAKQEGQAVIIGHIHAATVAFLEKEVPAAAKEITFVKASALAR